MATFLLFLEESLIMHLLRAILILELVGFASVLGLSPVREYASNQSFRARIFTADLIVMNGNLSTAISSPSPASTSPATITTAPSTVSAASNVTCPQCQVVARYGPLSVNFWWDSTLNLTLDTISVLVTQYNNTAVTRTTTIYEDVSSLNISTMTDEQSIAVSVLTAMDGEYEPNGFALNNGTNAFIDGSFSVAYPTPFIGIQGFEFISVTQQDLHCPKGLQSAEYDFGSGCVCMMTDYMDNPDVLQYAITSQITLSATYYEVEDPHPVNNDLAQIIEGPISINNSSYSDFIKSVLGSEGFNKYRSCAFLDVGVGPPALMMPVAALTATTTSTVKSAGNYGIPSPKPGNPVAPIAPPQTKTPGSPASVPIVEPKPEKEPQPESPTTPDVAPFTPTLVTPPLVPIVNSPGSGEESPSPGNPANSPVNEPAKSGDTDQDGNSEDQPAVGPSDSSKNGESNTGAQPVAGSSPGNDNGGGSGSGNTNPVPAAAVAISYAGSTITPDTSSHYSIPQIGNISPGGSPVTTNNIIYSLAPSATALISNGRTIALQTFAAPVLDTVKQAAAPALTFGGSTYTVDSSSHIVIAGQTIVPGASAIMVSNTPISLAPGAKVAVIAGQTQSLSPASITAEPVLTFQGSVFTPNAASAFVIAGQTLSPGGTISVSSTPISLATGAAFAVIAGSTQSLALAPAPTKPPTFTLNGSTYTAGTGNGFVIGSLTLTEGGVVTVAGTPISFASNGGDVVVGTSTEAVGIGGLIMSGFGNGGASATGPVLFTGGAVRCYGEFPSWSRWALLGGAAALGLR